MIHCFYRTLVDPMGPMEHMGPVESTPFTLDLRDLWVLQDLCYGTYGFKVRSDGTFRTHATPFYMWPFVWDLTYTSWALFRSHTTGAGFMERTDLITLMVVQIWNWYRENAHLVGIVLTSHVIKIWKKLCLNDWLAILLKTLVLLMPHY